MLTLLFIILMCVIFGRLIGFAASTAWGIAKVLFCFVFLPIVLIGIFIAGLVYFAIPILIIVGIVMLIKAIVH